MKANLRSRNISINAYVGMLIVTIVASFATLCIVRVANEVPFRAFASADLYRLN